MKRSLVILLLVALFLMAALPVASQEGVCTKCGQPKPPREGRLPLERKVIELPGGYKLHLEAWQPLDEEAKARRAQLAAALEGAAAAQAGGTIFFDNMEHGINGWTVFSDENGVDWHQVTNPEMISVLGPVAGFCATGVPDDINPDQVTLPDLDANGMAWLPKANAGTAWWFGDDTNGTYLDAGGFGCSVTCLDGGTSCAGQHLGILISPWIDLRGVQVADLSFRTWWEVESTWAQLWYDFMAVGVSTDGVIFYVVDIINDEAPPVAANPADIPWSSGGLNQPGKWVTRVVDLTPWTGQPVQIGFYFDTMDEELNGFRGWFIDDVRVTAGNRIAGWVYHDADVDHVADVPWSDEMDLGINGVVVELVETGERYTTGTSGWYNFNFVPLGTYTVRLVGKPSHWMGLTPEECQLTLDGTGSLWQCDFAQWWGSDAPLGTAQSAEGTTRVTLRAVQDADISAWTPGQNTGKARQLRVRQPGITASLVQFDLSSLPPDAQIAEAKLKLYGNGRSNSVHRLYMAAYGLKQPWVEDEVTWQQAAAGVPWEVPGAEGDGDRGPAVGWDWVDSESGIDFLMEFEITELVAEWLANPASNHGVLIRGEGSGEQAVEWFFPSRESNAVADAKPRLEITYSTP